MTFVSFICVANTFVDTNKSRFSQKNNDFSGFDFCFLNVGYVIIKKRRKFWTFVSFLYVLRVRNRLHNIDWAKYINTNGRTWENCRIIQLQAFADCIHWFCDVYLIQIYEIVYISCQQSGKTGLALTATAD